MCAGKRIIPDSDAEHKMRAFVGAYGCTIDSTESREMVGMLACDGLLAIDSDPESGACTRLSIASATSIPRTEEVDGAL